MSGFKFKIQNSNSIQPYPTVVSRKYMRVILLDNTQGPTALTVTGEQVLKKILEKFRGGVLEDIF